MEQKAKASGACKLVVKDLKEEFVRDYIFPCLRAGAIYERKYLLGTSMARPVIAKVSFKYFIRILFCLVDLLYEYMTIFMKTGHGGCC